MIVALPDLLVARVVVKLQVLIVPLTTFFDVANDFLVNIDFPFALDEACILVVSCAINLDGWLRLGLLCQSLHESICAFERVLVGLL